MTAGKIITVVLGRLPENISDKQFAQLEKRAAKGLLFSEYGYPFRSKGMSDPQFFQRLNEVDAARICAQITDVHRAADGHSLIGTVSPIGPFGSVLSAIIESEAEGKVVFGLRGFRAPGGNLDRLVTYDYIGLQQQEKPNDLDV